jgi:hypothetical protein
MTAAAKKEIKSSGFKVPLVILYAAYHMVAAKPTVPRTSIRGEEMARTFMVLSL